MKKSDRQKLEMWDEMVLILENCRDTISYVKHYVEGGSLSAEDDCDESLEHIRHILDRAKKIQEATDGN